MPEFSVVEAPDDLVFVGDERPVGTADAPIPDLSPEERTALETRLREMQSVMRHAKTSRERWVAKREVKRISAELRGGVLERAAAAWLNKRAAGIKGVFDREGFEAALPFLPGWKLTDTTMVQRLDAETLGWLLSRDEDPTVHTSRYERQLILYDQFKGDNYEGPPIGWFAVSDEDAVLDRAIARFKERAVATGKDKAPSNPELGRFYVSEVSPGMWGKYARWERSYRIARPVSVGIPAVLVTAPNGESTLVPADRADREITGFWKWAYDHGLRDSAKATHADAAKAIPPERKWTLSVSARTCGVCFRTVETLTGLRLAHHGYNFPGHRYRDSNACSGSSHQPWEVTTDPTTDWIGVLLRESEYLEGRMAEFPGVHEFRVLEQGVKQPDGTLADVEHRVTPEHRWWPKVRKAAWVRLVTKHEGLWDYHGEKHFPEFRSIPWYRGALHKWTPSDVRVGVPEVPADDVKPEDRYQGRIPLWEPPPLAVATSTAATISTPPQGAPMDAMNEVTEYLAFVRNVLGPTDPRFAAFAVALDAPGMLDTLAPLLEVTVPAAAVEEPSADPTWTKTLSGIYGEARDASAASIDLDKVNQKRADRGEEPDTAAWQAQHARIERVKGWVEAQDWSKYVEPKPLTVWPTHPTRFKVVTKAATPEPEVAVTVAVPVAEVPVAPVVNTAGLDEAIGTDIIRGPRPLYHEDPYGLTYRDRDVKREVGDTLEPLPVIADLATRYGVGVPDFYASLDRMTKGEATKTSEDRLTPALLHVLAGFPDPSDSYPVRMLHGGVFETFDYGDKLMESKPKYELPVGLARAVKYLGPLSEAMVRREASNPVWATELRVAREMIHDEASRWEATDEKSRGAHRRFEFTTEDRTAADAFLATLPPMDSYTPMTPGSERAAVLWLRWFVPRFLTSYTREGGYFPDRYKHFATSPSVGDFLVEFGDRFYPAWANFDQAARYRILGAASFEFKAQGDKPPEYTGPLSPERLIGWLRTHTNTAYGNNPWTLKHEPDGIALTFLRTETAAPFTYKAKSKGGKREQMDSLAHDPNLWRSYYAWYWRQYTGDMRHAIEARWDRVGVTGPPALEPGIVTVPLPVVPTEVPAAAEAIETVATITPPALGTALSPEVAFLLPVGSVVQESTTANRPAGASETPRLLVKTEPPNPGWHIFGGGGAVTLVTFESPADFKFGPYTLLLYGDGTFPDNRQERFTYYTRVVPSASVKASAIGTLGGKKLDAEVDRLFNLHGNNVQFDIMDLGKISAETKAAYAAGTPLEDAMLAAIAKYRKDAAMAVPTVSTHAHAAGPEETLELAGKAAIESKLAAELATPAAPYVSAEDTERLRANPLAAMQESEEHRHLYREFLPLPINTVVTFGGSRTRRYVIVRNVKLHGYAMVALSGGDKGSGPSGVRHPNPGEPAKWPAADIVVEPDQTIEFTGVEAPKRRREYEKFFHWKDIGGGRAEAGRWDARAYAGLAYKQVPPPAGVAVRTERRARQALAPGERKATWASTTHGTVTIIEGAKGRRDDWQNISVTRPKAFRYGWNGSRWAKSSPPPADLKAEVIERGWGSLFGWTEPPPPPEDGGPEGSEEGAGPEEFEAAEETPAVVAPAATPETEVLIGGQVGDTTGRWRQSVDSRNVLRERADGWVDFVDNTAGYPAPVLGRWPNSKQKYALVETGWVPLPPESEQRTVRAHGAVGSTKEGWSDSFLAWYHAQKFVPAVLPTDSRWPALVTRINAAQLPVVEAPTVRPVATVAVSEPTPATPAVPFTGKQRYQPGDWVHHGGTDMLVLRDEGADVVDLIRPEALGLPEKDRLPEQALRSGLAPAPEPEVPSKQDRGEAQPKNPASMVGLGFADIMVSYKNPLLILKEEQIGRGTRAVKRTWVAVWAAGGWHTLGEPWTEKKLPVREVRARGEAKVREVEQAYKLLRASRYKPGEGTPDPTTLPLNLYVEAVAGPNPEDNPIPWPDLEEADPDADPEPEGTGPDYQAWLLRDKARDDRRSSHEYDREEAQEKAEADWVLKETAAKTTHQNALLRALGPGWEDVNRGNHGDGIPADVTKSWDFDELLTEPTDPEVLAWAAKMNDTAVATGETTIEDDTPASETLRLRFNYVSTDIVRGGGPVRAVELSQRVRGVRGIIPVIVRDLDGRIEVLTPTAFFRVAHRLASQVESGELEKVSDSTMETFRKAAARWAAVPLVAAMGKDAEGDEMVLGPEATFNKAAREIGLAVLAERQAAKPPATQPGMFGREDEKVEYLRRAGTGASQPHT